MNANGVISSTDVITTKRKCGDLATVASTEQGAASAEHKSDVSGLRPAAAGLFRKHSRAGGALLSLERDTSQEVFAVKALIPVSAGKRAFPAPEV